MRALVIEDEKQIAAFIERGLEAEGFVVDIASDGAIGLELARTIEPDVIVLDLILPGLRGEDVLRALRADGSSTPVIILTAKDAVTDRVANLEAGADDYLIKPFSFTELLARIRVRMRQTPGSPVVSLSAEGLVADLRTHEVRADGRTVELTAREFNLLTTLLAHPRRVFSQAELLDRVWGYDHDPGSNIVEVYVAYLRRKLGRHRIETVRGFGYRMGRGL